MPSQMSNQAQALHNLCACVAEQSSGSAPIGQHMERPAVAFAYFDKDAPEDGLDYFTYRPSPTQPDDYLTLASEPASREEIRMGAPGGGEWFGQWLHLSGRHVGFDPLKATSEQRAAIPDEDIIHWVGRWKYRMKYWPKAVDEDFRIPSAWFRHEYPFVEPLMALLNPKSEKIEYTDVKEKEVNQKKRVSAPRRKLLKPSLKITQSKSPKSQTKITRKTLPKPHKQTTRKTTPKTPRKTPKKISNLEKDLLWLQGNSSSMR